MPLPLQKVKCILQKIYYHNKNMLFIKFTLQVTDTDDSLVYINNQEEETTLSEETKKRFEEIANYGVIEVVGDDTAGRKTIVVYACRLPAKEVLNLQILLE